MIASPDDRAIERLVADGRISDEAVEAKTGKSMRVTWVDGKTSLDVNFYSKAQARTR